MDACSLEVCSLEVCSFTRLCMLVSTWLIVYDRGTRLPGAAREVNDTNVHARPALPGEVWSAYTRHGQV
jgi:hypothetical protein